MTKWEEVETGSLDELGVAIYDRMADQRDDPSSREQEMADVAMALVGRCKLAEAEVVRLTKALETEVVMRGGAMEIGYEHGFREGAEAMREAAMRLPARVVFTEVAGLERLKLQGADRDDWLIRTTARKVLRQLSEHLARLPLPGAKEVE